MSIKYRDSTTLKLAGEINDFVRSRTEDPIVGSVALEAAKVTFSLVEWPRESNEHLKQGDQSLSEVEQACQ